MASRRESRRSPGLTIVIAVLLLMAVGVAFQVRATNTRWFHGYDAMDPDSASFIRLVKIVSHPGPPPRIDPDTWVPLGRDYRGFSLLFPRLLADAHRIIRMRYPRVSLEAVAFFYPAFCSAASTLILFWALLPFLGAPAALLAAAAWGLVPVVAERTMIGYIDRDAACLLLTFAQLGCYYRAIDARSGRRRCTWGLASGLVTLFYLSIWAGAGLISSMIVLAEFCLWLRSRSDLAQRQRFLPWAACLVVPGIEGVVSPYHWLATSFLNMAPAFALSALLVLTPAVRRLRPKSTPLGHAGIGPVVILAAGLAAAGIALFALRAGGADAASKLVEMLAVPMGYSRLLMTVGELQTPKLWMWRAAFGAIAIPCAAGIALLTNALRSRKPSRGSLGASVAWLAFTAAAVGAPSFISSSRWRWADALYLPAGALLIALTIPGAEPEAARFADGKPDSEADAGAPSAGGYLILSWLAVGLWASRGGVRFWMFLAPCLLALSAYSIRRLLDRFAGNCAGPLLLGATGASLLALCLNMTLPATIGLAACAAAAIGALSADPSEARIPWISIGLGMAVLASAGALFVCWKVEVIGNTRDKAADWYRHYAPLLRDLHAALPARSVTLAYWDKGSTLAWYLDQRTVVDSEHYIPYWIYLASRDVFNGRDPRAALRFLLTHRTQYLLITSLDMASYDMDRWMSSGESGRPPHRLAPLRSVTVRRSSGGALDVYGTVDPELAAGLAASEPPGRPRPVRIEMGLRVAPPPPEPAGAPASAHASTMGGPVGAEAEYFYAGSKQTRVMEQAWVGQQWAKTRLQHALHGALIAVPGEGASPWSLYYVRPEELGSLSVRLFLERERIPGFDPVLVKPEYGLWRIRYPADLKPDPDDLHTEFPPDRLTMWKRW